MGKDDKSMVGALLTLGAGIFAGWTLRKYLQRRYDEVVDLPTSLRAETVSDQELLHTLFDEYSTEAQAYFEQVQGQVRDSVMRLQDQWAKVDKRKYRQLVDEAIAEAQKEQPLPKRKVDKLRDYLMDDWEDLRATLRDEAKKTKQAAKQA